MLTKNKPELTTHAGFYKLYRDDEIDSEYTLAGAIIWRAAHDARQQKDKSLAAEAYFWLVYGEGTEWVGLLGLDRWIDAFLAGLPQACKEPLELLHTAYPTLKELWYGEPDTFTTVGAGAG